MTGVRYACVHCGWEWPSVFRRPTPTAECDNCGDELEVIEACTNCGGQGFWQDHNGLRPCTWCQSTGCAV